MNTLCLHGAEGRVAVAGGGGEGGGEEEQGKEEGDWATS